MSHFEWPVHFLATAKPVESRHFFEIQLGLPCLSDDPYAVVFELGSTTLRIQKVDLVPDVPYTVLGWQVDDIQLSVQELTEKGIRFELFSHLVQNDEGIWNSPGGASVAWFKDPDGNTLSLTQL